MLILRFTSIILKLERSTNKQKILADIQIGKEQVLQEIYNANRDAFLMWSKKRFSCSEEDILDAYQDAMIVFYNNVKNKKITNLESTIKTYIFAIGKNLLLKSYASNQKTTLTDTIDDKIIKGVDYTVGHKIELTHRQEVLSAILNQMGEVCANIIKLYYYRNFSIEAIKNELGYKHVDVVKSQKLRCMKKLKTMAKAHKDSLF